MRLPGEPFGALGIELFGVAAPPDGCAARLGFAPGSVIVCAIPYYTGEFARANVARYAALPDYHRVVAGLLRAAAASLAALVPGRYDVYVDNSPFREKPLAARAGLGVIGRNTLLLTEKYGSFVNLGCIAAEPVFDPTGDGGIHACENCGRCAAACPGGALSADADGGVLFDRTRCVSAITQKRGALADRERDLLRRAGYAAGCDICQNVCPRNAAPALSPFAALYTPAEPWLTPENLPALHPTRAFGWRPPEVYLRNLEILDE